jgi:pimeloyl-ACP methyl ester carboxylesterase
VRASLLPAVSLEREHLHAQTSDGLLLSIEHLRSSARPARGAIVMLHGLGANRMVFLATGASLAEHLAQSGFDCYVPELRGAGRSERPRAGWTLNDYLERDIPALIERVLHASGQSQLSWIGHSMGGLLMMMYAIEHPEAPVSRLIALGSALDYRPGHNVYQSLRRLRKLAGPLREFPFGLIARALSPLAGIGPILPAEGMNFHRSNVARAVCRELMASGFATIPLALFDSLATTFNPEGFSRVSDTRGRIAYLEHVSELRLPTLLVAGSRDVQCPPKTAQATFELLTGVADKHALFVGKPYGQPDDYGHLDLLVGKRAAQEVWPHISAFVCAGEPNADDRVAAS